MLSEEEKKAIEIFTDLINYLEKWNKNLTVVPDDKKYYEILLNIITKLQKEVEHQKEKRENQKTELAILNEKQKEMNKLKNTVSSYCGMFRKQEREIRKLQKENEEKDKQIDLMAERIEWLCKSNGVLLDVEHGENFFQEDIKQYFERKVK